MSDHRISSPVMALLGFAAQSYLKDPSESNRSNLNAYAGTIASQFSQELGANERFQWGCVHSPATWLLENATALKLPVETVNALTMAAESHADYRKRMGVGEPEASTVFAGRAAGPEEHSTVEAPYRDMGDILADDMCGTEEQELAEYKQAMGLQGFDVPGEDYAPSRSLAQNQPVEPSSLSAEEQEVAAFKAAYGGGSQRDMGDILADDMCGNDWDSSPPEAA